MEKVTAYMRAHPWATGIIVVVGGIIFIMLVRGGGGGGSSASGEQGPSDAEIAANAQIEAAKIGAQAQASAAGAAIQQAQIGAGVQMNSDKLASEVAMRSLDVQQTLGLDEGVTNRSSIEAQRDVNIASINGQVAQVQAYTGSQVKMNSSNNKQKNVSGLIGLAGSVLSIFSDQSLKENIKLIGQDKTGRNVYSFNYKGSKVTRTGYIAQDVARSEPEKVIKDERTGYLRVKTLGIVKAKNNATEGYPLISLPVLTNPFNGEIRSF